MIKNFLRFIYESKYDSLSEDIAKSVMTIITDSARPITKRRIQKTLEYFEPISFSLTLFISRDTIFEPEKRKHFKNIPWEKSNFKNNGFALDANSFIPTNDDIVDPEIEIHLIINPESEQSCHRSLYYKLLDAIRHEIEHLLQKGTNVQYSHTGFQVDKNRKSAESSFNYFLLPDEVPAMVSGMRLSSISKDVPIDQEFEEYLAPIKDSGFITDEQFKKVMKNWIKFTIKHFPETKISKKYRVY